MYNSTRAAKNSTFDISLKEGEMVTVQCQESAALTTNCSDLNLLSKCSLFKDTLVVPITAFTREAIW